MIGHSPQRIGGVIYRRATEDDLYPLMRLYQVTLPAAMSPLSEITPAVARDALLLNARRLKECLSSPKFLWIVAEKDGSLVAALSLLVDTESRLARIRRFYVDPAWNESEEMLATAMPLLTQYLKDKAIEVLYAATRTLTFAQQELTLSLGFKMLGIFPEARGGDPRKLSGLTAYFMGDVLKAHRYTDFALHPLIAPFYEIARRECGLDALPVLSEPEAPVEEFESLPTLEIIHAPHFVNHRFERLKSRQSLSVHFYPFHEPNALVTDPAQRIEIFLRTIPEMRFAAIIGERLERAVDPAELYLRLAMMLRDQGFGYVEIINDAADPWGIECISRAGFVPCGYFPAFKPHGEVRRDYVVFARAFEKLFARSTDFTEVSQAYLDYLTEFYRIEAHQYLDRIRRASPRPVEMPEPSV